MPPKVSPLSAEYFLFRLYGYGGKTEVDYSKLAGIPATK